MKKKKNSVTVIKLFVLFIVGFMLGGYVGKERGVPFVKRRTEWTIGIYTGKLPFDLGPCSEVSNPVLTAKDVTDVVAKFVADPFMIRENDKWYMFFEVLNQSSKHGDIGLAVSKDGFDWQYEKIVLDEPFHLSYPNVFKWEDEYYMIPESSFAYAIGLYKAVEFPDKWLHVKNLITGNYVDPSIFRYDGRWWMFASERNDVLRLFYSNELAGEWREHPESPLIVLDANIARPGGRVLVYDGRIFRYTQDCEPDYGNQVRAFEITELTPESYKEKAVSANPILKASGEGWNAKGMHHVDPHQIDGADWMACVDGYGKNTVFGLKF